MGLLLAAGLATLLWLEVLRVWLPSVIFIFGDAGSTPATTMGAFAAVWFLIPVVAAFFMGRRSPRRLWLVAVAVLGIVRLLLPATGGGDAQLALSTAGVTAGGLALVALGAGAASGHRARVGMLLGIGVEVTVRAALGSVGLIWWDTPAAWIAATALVVGLAVTSMAAPVDREPGQPPATPGAAWPWLLVGPAVVLVGVLSAPVSRGTLSTGWSPGVVAAILAAAHLTAVLVAMAAHRRRPVPTGVTGATAVALGTVLAMAPSSPTAIAGQCLVPLGLGLILASGARDDANTTARQGALAVAGGLVILLVAAFLYYAAYDIVLPFPNRVVLLGVAAFATALGLVGAVLPRRAPLPAPPGGVLRVVAGLAAVALAALGVGMAAAAEAPEEPQPMSLPVRVMLYNVHMGFDITGRLALDDLAAVIEAEQPDVVVLNEVDRGWLLNGGQDVLHGLEQRLGMTGVFAPAADEVWGNAVLSRLPVAEATVERLPRSGAPMARSAVTVVLDLADGGQLGIIGTHLHHTEDGSDVRLAQTRALAAATVRLRGRGIPVALMGDLNAEPGDSELAPLLELLSDGLPRPTRTFPSWDPQIEIDHLLVSEELETRDVRVPRSVASDHLPVAATLVRADG